MRKREKRDKDFQSFVDKGGLKYLEEATTKKAKRKKDEERKRQEEEGIIEFFAILICCIFVMVAVGVSFYFTYFEPLKSLLNDNTNLIMKGRY